MKHLYVLFWNKLYFDEIYDAVFVLPNLRVARAAQRDRARIVDRSLHLLVSTSVHTALWLWRVLEGAWPRPRRGRHGHRFDVDGALAVAGTRRTSHSGLGRPFVAPGRRRSGAFLQRKELHTLQEHLLLVVGGLAALLALFYLGHSKGLAMTDPLTAHLISVLIAVPFLTIASCWC